MIGLAEVGPASNSLSWQMPMGIGALLFVFARPITNFVVDEQNRAWSWNWGPKTRKLALFTYRILGVAMILYGALVYDGVLGQGSK
jgi:Na+/alanine symporter